MSVRPRMTVQISGDKPGSREVKIYFNPQARERFVAELMKLDRSDDHFHVFNFEECGGLRMSEIPYSPDDEVIPALKVLLRYDDWDEKYFPHMMTPPKDD